MSDRARISDRMHSELLNWSRWCWSGPWPHPIPAWGGIERDYRVPEEEAYRDDDKPPPVNARMAQAVDEAWKSLFGVDRLVLKAEYPGRSGKGRSVEAARLGIPLREYERALTSAVRRVEEAIDAVCA